MLQFLISAFLVCSEFALALYFLGFPGGLTVKNPPAKAGDMGSIPESGRALKKEMSTHSSVLAWEIPWTEKPGGLQSTGSQKVRQNLVTKQQQQLKVK